MYKYIRKWIYEEVDRPIIVKVQYPDIQIDEFEYHIPFKEGGIFGKFDRLGILTSTIFNNKLYYEYCVLNVDCVSEKQRFIDKMKNKIKENKKNPINFNFIYLYLKKK